MGENEISAGLLGKGGGVRKGAFCKDVDEVTAVTSGVRLEKCAGCADRQWSGERDKGKRKDAAD